MKYLVFAILISCNSSAKKEQASNLVFFNLNGKVKLFAEIKVNLSCSKNDDFVTFDKFQANYHEFNFDQNGKLTSITNKNPSPYATNGTRIKIEHENNKLSVIQKSQKEIYRQDFSISGDSLFVSKYNKIDDARFDYHMEKFKQKVYLKNGNKYTMLQEREGTNNGSFYITEKYIVELNKEGFEETVYKLNFTNDTIPLYKITYLDIDNQGNWTRRQFKYVQVKSYDKCFTEHRKIEYY